MTERNNNLTNSVDADSASRKKIEVMEAVHSRNEELAEAFNQELSEKEIFCVNVMGAPGVGKTSSLIPIIEGLDSPAYVIEGDIESDIDTKKLNSLGIQTVQINTGGACHLDSPLVAEAFQEENFSKGFLFIENIGNLVCPAEFMIGEHIKLLISSVTEGSDKPYKYPLAFEKADMILLNKCDLLPYVDFDLDFYLTGIQKLNPAVPVFQISATKGDGMKEAVIWLQNRAKTLIKS